MNTTSHVFSRSFRPCAHSLRRRPTFRRRVHSLHVEPLENRRVLAAAWPASSNGTSNEAGYGIATLADGSAIFTGYYSAAGMTAAFGGTTYPTEGFGNAFISKMNADGSFAWTTQTTRTGQAEAVGKAIVTLADGSAIVAGSFSNTVGFGGTTLVSGGDKDVFVAKVNPDGSFAWAQKAGGSTADVSNGITAIADGSVILTGIFTGTATFGANTLASSGGFEIFVAKVNADGTFAWAKQAGGTQNDAGQSVSTFTDGSSIVTGTFSGTASFFGGGELTSRGNTDLFVARLDANGALSWLSQGGGPGFDGGVGVATLADGSSIVAAQVQADFAIGATTLPGFGGYDVLIARFDAGGTPVQAGMAGGTDNDFCQSIDALPDGSAIVSGYFKGTSAFGTTSLTSAGDWDVFITKSNADGSFAWATRAGGADRDISNGVAVFADGSSIVSGYYGFNMANATSTFGDVTLTVSGQSDAFAARLSPDGRFGNPPLGTNLTTATVAENQPIGTLVGVLVTTDADTGDTFTYTLVAGEGDEGNGAFTIEQGELRTAKPLNFEVTPSPSVRVRATDSRGFSTESIVTVTVTDVVDEVLAVESITAVPGAFRAGRAVRFVVDLTENVSVQGKPQLRLRIGSTARLATYVAGAGTARLVFDYRVRPGENAADVQSGATFVLGKKAAITAGAEKLGSVIPQALANVVVPGVRVDTRPPKSVGLVPAPAPGAYTAGQTINFVVTFSETVVVTGTPTLSMTGLNAARQAAYFSGSGTQSLMFRYIVQPSDVLAGNKKLNLAKSIVLAAGSAISDEAGNAAVRRIRVAPLSGIQINGSLQVTPPA